MKIYAKINNFTILAITEDNQLKKWTVGDRQGERVTDKVFNVASDAIGWANTNYVGLVK